MRRRAVIWIIVAFVALWIIASAAPNLYLNWLWFGEVNYRQIFWGILVTKINLGLVFGLAFFVLVMANAWLARRLAPSAAWYEAESRFRRQAAELFEQYVNRYLLLALAAFVGVVSYGVGSGAASQWQKYLLYRHATPFGIADPIFNRDVSFYVFKLPFIEYVWQWIYLTLFAVLIIAAAVHYLDKAIRVLGGVPAFAPHVKGHLSVILGLILLAKAVAYQLDAWNLLYSARGVAFGISYTDHHAQLPALYILMVIAVLCSLAVLINIHFRGLWLPIAGIAFLITASLLVNVMYPAAIQRFQVQPNEFLKERPYIKHNIEFTRHAYQLDKIREVDMPELGQLTAAELAATPGVVQNIRLWDWRPLLQTYKKLQELRPYYEFLDVDIDRYVMAGDYRQVMLSPRELSLDQLPEKTWQNSHLLYTHGYGLVLSPVNRVDQEGLPMMLVKNLPAESLVPEIEVTRPQIYFGESDINYSIVNAAVEEIDYATFDKTETTAYAGAAGIRLSNGLVRTAAALRFGEVNILVSGNVTAKSKIIINRDIKTRTRLIAPFLEYDNDPYLVIGDDGHLYWIHDAYTRSGRYPYSEPAPGPVNVNYVRNAVKVVTDAYDGTVNFYIADTEDPIVRTWAAAFPGAFRPLEQMPQGLQAHLRWPEGLFMLQSTMYQIYHMTDSQIFYTKEDKWDIARESAQKGLQSRSGEQASLMPPYYVVTLLPDEQETELILMRPYTPAGKPNMIAWLCARSDPENYGEILVYRFPRHETVFGPMMVEARIEQDTDISAALTLWRSKGSDVIRGNLLVIPVGKALLYVEPLFMRAQESEIPELKRVIVAVGQVGGNATVVMRETLDEALEAALGGTAIAAPQEQPTGEAAPAEGPPAESARQLVGSALGHYRNAQERLRAGDWSGYGDELAAMERDLRQLEELQR
ncbi:MAG: UPF0182 family protein [Armatimonadota bacterium]|nr:MAG: UPF0182 family protein [Armatimonadota bacterium]